MARAKRTDRTDARRRHRAERAALVTAIEAGEAPVREAPARKPAPSPQAATTAARPSIGGAFRTAFHPLDLRGDLAALPGLVRHWSLWVPILLTAGATILFVTGTSNLTDPETQPSDTLATVGILGYQLFVAPPPVAAAFLAGFGAPRASWLIGMIVGLVAAIGFTFVVLSPFGRLTYTDPAPWIVQGFLFAPLGAAMFAAAAAWYRRFLNLANPNRGRRPPGNASRGARSKSRPVVSRTSSRR